MNNEPEIQVQNETPPSEKKTNILSEIFGFIEIFVFSACFVILLFSFGFRLARVDGPSMENTLKENEILVVSDLFYDPAPGDILVFYEINDYYKQPIVKRVIATEGQEVDIDFATWTLKVNGEIIEEPYAKIEGFSITSSLSYPYTVPKGHLFVMGDNRNNSTDSRDLKIGPVDERKVIGKVILRVLPINKFGFVE